MHCSCCDKLLSDKEATRKYKDSGEYLDMCDTCIREAGLPVNKMATRADLDKASAKEESPFENFKRELWNENDYDE